MSTTILDTAPRQPVPDRRTCMRLARAEYERFADALAALDPADWKRPTVCTAWDVRRIAGHTVGMAEMAASMRESRRQQKIAGAEAAESGTRFIDELTALQVREHDDWTPEQLVAGMRAIGPKAVRGRRMAPFFLRGRAIPQPQVISGVEETWTLGYVLDTILTRDPWMHRMDIAAATGRAPTLTPGHDGRIVADVVAEWAERHGQPYRLTLSGPAGGTWSSGEGGQEITMDAVDFCRVLSGRGTGEGLMATEVPF